jgi:hypothetical protein
MTITKTCGLAAVGEAVGIATPIVWLGSAGDGAMLGTDACDCVDGDVNEGKPQPTTNAPVHNTTRKARIRSPFSHRDFSECVGAHGVGDHIPPVTDRT